MPADSERLDPLYVDARREAIWIVAIFSLFAIVSLTISLSLGWSSPTESVEANKIALKTVFGMPTWVFWGVFLPWVAACLVSVGFAFFVMKDGDLGETQSDNAEEINAQTTNSQEINAEPPA